MVEPGIDAVREYLSGNGCKITAESGDADTHVFDLVTPKGNYRTLKVSRERSRMYVEEFKKQILAGHDIIGQLEESGTVTL